MKLGVQMICAEDEEFIGLALDSVLNYADKVVIVGNPNRKTRKLIFQPRTNQHKITLVWREWDGSYANSRNRALEFLQDCDYVLQLDADEFVTNPFYLRDATLPCYCLEYVHFIGNLGQIDATCDPHVGINRFYVPQGTEFHRAVHELASNPKFNANPTLFPNVKLLHFGYLKSLSSIGEKFQMNMAKSEVHSHEFLATWARGHLFGTYPVKPFDVKELPPEVVAWFSGIR